VVVSRDAHSILHEVFVDDAPSIVRFCSHRAAPVTHVFFDIVLCAVPQPLSSDATTCLADAESSVERTCQAHAVWRDVADCTQGTCISCHDVDFMIKRQIEVRCQPVSDHLFVVCTLFLSLVYVGMPVTSAVFQSLSLLCQGAIGTLLLRYLLRGSPTSGLFVLGPGLIIGSSLTLLIFNLLGRGVPAVIGVWLIGIASVATLIAHGQVKSEAESSNWIYCNLLCLAALSLSWQYPEFVLVAIGFFTIGLSVRREICGVRWISHALQVFALMLVAAPILLRKPFWFLVTDDYSLFEMMSQHFTSDGPLAKWGSISFTRYHWLPYAWSGLVDELGVNPPGFFTLSLTMPLVYTLSMCSSLLLIAGRVRMQNASSLATLPLLAIVSLTLFDWSGTSGAGVYAVNAAVACLVVSNLESTPPLFRRLLLWGLLVPVVTFTKLPSLFLLTIMVMMCEVLCLVDVPRLRNSPLVIGVLTVCGFVLLLPAMSWLGHITDGYSIVQRNPALGSPPGLSFVGVLFGLAISKAPLIVPVFLSLLGTWVCRRELKISRAQAFLIGLGPLVVVGLILDLVISGDSEGFAYGNSNRFQYFSGPMYFAGALALICTPFQLTTRRLTLSSRLGIALTFVFVTGAGLLWRAQDLNWKIARLVFQQIRPNDALLETWFGFMSVDFRVGSAALALLTGVCALVWRRPTGTTVIATFLLSLTTLTTYQYIENAKGSFRRERTSAETEWLYGPPRNRIVGLWLLQNTSEDAIIATNSLLDRGTDFSLATWSQREFLVLGLSFSPVYGEIERQTDLSFRFGENPTLLLARELRRFGVTWFLADRRVSDLPKWEVNWDVRFSNNDFVIVRLPSID